MHLAQTDGPDETAAAKVSVLAILVVDDEENYRSVVRRYLQKMGHVCSVAANAAEALKEIRDMRFNLVISDILMNEKNGLELMLEAKQFHPDLDFIIMTGHPSEYSFIDIIAQGAYDYIFKPFDMGELNAKIKRLQREKALVDRLKQANEALSWEAEVNSTIALLSRKLMDLKSLDEMALLVLEKAKRLTSSHLGYIGYVELETGRIVSPTVALENIQSLGDDGLRRAFEDLAQWALRHGESLLSNGFEDPELLGISTEGYFPLDRILSVPAIANGKVLGQIILANSTRDYSDQDMMLVQSLAAMYALATQHLRTALHLRRANEYMENIFENSPDAIDRMAVELYGYTLEELKNKTAVPGAYYSEEFRTRHSGHHFIRDNYVNFFFGKNAVLEELENRHPGITSVKRDMGGAVEISDIQYDLDALVEEIKDEVGKSRSIFKPLT